MVDAGGTPPHLRPGADAPENRRHGRRKVAAAVGVELEGHAPLTGRTQDISFGGAFVACDPPPAPPGTTGRLVITPDDAPDEIIVFHCVLVRVAESGAGFRLLETDPLGHERFTELMRQAGDLDPLLEEARVNYGFSVSTPQGLRRALD